MALAVFPQAAACCSSATIIAWISTFLLLRIYAGSSTNGRVDNLNENYLPTSCVLPDIGYLTFSLALWCLDLALCSTLQVFVPVSRSE